MNIGRRLVRSEAGQRLVCRLIAEYIRLVHRTSRWTVIGGEAVREIWARRETSILAFWHGRLLMVPYSWPADIPGRILISGARDGRIITGAIGHFGREAVVGSTSKGGSAALRTILKGLKEGQSIGITPDGPRGPAMRVSPGIIAIARLAQVPILPLSFATTRRRILGSWDRFHLALPFSRGVYVWGEPILVPRDGDLEEWRLILEDRLNGLTAAADQAVGHTPVRPAPPTASQTAANRTAVGQTASP